MTRGTFRARQIPQLSVASQQRPIVLYHESKGEGVDQREGRPPAPVAERPEHAVPLQLHYAEPACNQVFAAVTPQLSFLEQIRDHHHERETKYGLYQ